VLPSTSGPVPLKSKVALLSFLSMVSCSLIGVPSSIYYTFVRVSTYLSLLLTENLYSSFLTDSAAFSHINLT
jgi:hypothetical protein